MHLPALLAVLPLLLSQVHGLDTCPDGWMEAHGVDMGCLYFSHPKDHKSHDDAKAYCVEKHEEVNSNHLTLASTLRSLSPGLPGGGEEPRGGDLPAPGPADHGGGVWGA